MPGDSVAVKNVFEHAVLSYQNVSLEADTTLEDVKNECLKQYNERAGSAGIPEEDWDSYVVQAGRGKCPDQTNLAAQYRYLSYLELKEVK